MNPVVEAELGDRLSQVMNHGDTVHLEGGGVWGSGIIERSDDEGLSVLLFEARDGMARLPPGTAFELQRAVRDGVLIAQVPLTGYDAGNGLLHFEPPAGALRVERRQYSRVQVRVGACVFHDRRALPEVGWTINVAAGGAAVELPPSEMAVEDWCDIWLRIPGAPVQVKARLLAVTPSYRFEFWHLAPVQEERLLRFLLKEETEQRRLRVR
jgi:PilZ domain